MNSDKEKELRFIRGEAADRGRRLYVWDFSSFEPSSSGRRDRRRTVSSDKILDRGVPLPSCFEASEIVDHRPASSPPSGSEESASAMIRTGCILDFGRDLSVGTSVSTRTRRASYIRVLSGERGSRRKSVVGDALSR